MGVGQINIQKTLLYFVGALGTLLGAMMLFPASAGAQASPVVCAGPYVGYERQDSCGYFHNQGWDSGPDLRGGTWDPDTGTWTYASGSDPGIPEDVDTAQEFINMILSDYNTGDQRARTAAEFMILSMIGVTPTQDQSLAKTVTPAQIIEWQDRVLSYANIDDNTDGSGTSTGTNGSITWKDFRGLSCGDTNTYYQIPSDDVAVYEVTVGNDPDCATGTALQSDHIVFEDSGGNELLQIRRLCMNPTGDPLALEAAEPVEQDGTLGDQVFEDKNDDGVFNSDDEGISGVTVALYESTTACEQGNLLATTTTDGDGQYQFSDLPVISTEGTFANYVVAVTDDQGVLSNYEATRGALGEDDNAQDPSGYCMTLAFMERSNQTGDFGYYRVESGAETLAPTGNSMPLLILGAGFLSLAGVGLLTLRQYSRFTA